MINNMDTRKALAIAKGLKKAKLLPADLPREQYGEAQRFLVAYASFLIGIANPNTRDHYRLVINHFMRYLQNIKGCTPLGAVGIDVSVWRDDLRRTGGVYGIPRGVSASKYFPQANSSIENKTSVLSAFFGFLQKPGMDGSDPLMRANPVKALHTRFKVEKWGNSKKIDKNTLKKCLKQIDRSRVLGMRNYAIIYGYYMTGRRNSEWVNLKWG